LILSCRFLSPLDRKSRLLPSIESAYYCPDLVVSALLKFSRQTGA
jgi:hypothetical protein